MQVPGCKRVGRSSRNGESWGIRKCCYIPASLMIFQWKAKLQGNKSRKRLLRFPHSPSSLMFINLFVEVFLSKFLAWVFWHNILHWKRCNATTNSNLSFARGSAVCKMCTWFKLLQSLVAPLPHGHWWLPASGNLIKLFTIVVQILSDAILGPLH